MTGACTIDETDIATLGALILRGGDHGFISFPTRKEPIIIEWPDEDGFEIGDDDPVYEAKKFTVNYYLKGDELTFLDRVNAFASLHFVNSNNMVYVREFDLTFDLRFAGISRFLINRGFTRDGEKSARISVDYVMDNPTQFFNPAITDPTAVRENQTQVEIGGVDLADFGIIVKDIYPSAFKLAPKTNIIYNSRYANGQDVVFHSVLKKEKQQIAIACTMICDDKETFMVNWHALWNAVNVASLTLELVAAGKSFTAYYASMNDFRKRPWTQRGLAEFELNFVGYEI